MAKYILMDLCEHDLFDQEFETAEEAITEGQCKWERLTKYDKKQRQEFYVLESANPDPDAEDHFDGNPIKIWK